MTSSIFLCLAYLLTPISSTWQEVMDPESGYLMMINVGSTETSSDISREQSSHTLTLSPHVKRNVDYLSEDRPDLETPITIKHAPLTPTIRKSDWTITSLNSVEKSETMGFPETPIGLSSNSNGMTLNHSDDVPSTEKLGRKSSHQRARLKKRMEKLGVNINLSSEPSPTAPVTTSPTISPTISMERLDKGISSQNRKKRKSIKSRNETDDEILKQHMEQMKGQISQKQTQHIQQNRTTVALFGLISSQRDLHYELQQHLFSTRKSDLFISMMPVPDCKMTPGMACKTYWTKHDDILAKLTEILTNPNKWYDVEAIKDLLVSTLNYFAMWKNTEEVDELVMLLDEIYSNKSKEHYQLCQDIRYSIMVFRRMIDRDIAHVSDGTVFRVKLTVNMENLDLTVHWWSLALCKLVQRTNHEAKLVFNETAYGRYFFQATDDQEMEDSLRFFTHHSSRIKPEVERYTQYVIKTQVEGKVTKLEFLLKAAEMGASIEAHFQVIIEMKRDWVMAMQCFDWLQMGYTGEVTIIVPFVQSMALTHMLLKDIGICEEDQMMIQVERQMQLARVQKNKVKKGTGLKGRVKEIPTFKMTNVSPQDLAEMANDDKLICKR